MRSAWFNRTLLLFILSVSLFACRDRNRSTVVPKTPIAGKGGLATMRVVTEHTGVQVDSGMVYIKYNAVARPADNKYDDSAAIYKEEGTPLVIFPGLTQGDYFLYMKGWDIIRSKTVAATRPYTISKDGAYGMNYIVLQAIPQ